MAKLQVNKHLGKVINGVTVGEEVLRNGLRVKLSATCHCGVAFEVWLCNIMSGRTVDCGCAFRNACRYNNNKPIYATWGGMVQRCTNLSQPDYYRYVGRGITVCQEWRESFEAFETWALANGYSKGLQLDRINNDGNYEPGNCRFVTPKENSSNRSSNTYVWLDGLVLTAAEASRQLGHRPAYVSNLKRDGRNPYFPRLILNPPKA